ncbi:MAG: hypothetical protein JST52_01365 [Bacteroidetes bacterium]|nr:hypothetical protein [Bacteroidota bacterium]MBS1741207.1 hypothetical protein [Bacteroidota bacterium]
MKFLFPILTCFLLIVFLSSATQTDAQNRRKKKAAHELTIYDIDTLIHPIPLQRKMWHDKIDRAQRIADVADGKVDGLINYGEDTTATHLLTQSIIKDVSHMQVMIENLPYRDSNINVERQQKIRYLSDLNEMVGKFNRDDRVDPVFWHRTTENFRQLLIARHEGRLLDFVHQHPDIYTLENIQLLAGNKEAIAFVYTEVGKKDPLMMIERLPEYAKEPFACNIIAAAAKKDPSRIYNYASSTNYLLSNAVRNCNDPLVQTIVRISTESKTPLKAMPFLAWIFNGTKTISEIDRITSNPDLFYKSLIQLKIENKDGLADKTLTSEIQYRGLRYVRDMNDLHEEKDPIRFKCLDGFLPHELYYIMVYGQDEIYTSSFLGTFKRMLERMGDTMSGSGLFEKVNYDKFRTFIRMCAGYNTLSTFLGTMSKEKKTKLMTDFIAGLDKGPDDELEDAVDVADAFGSINDEDLLNFLQAQVKVNYERSYREKSMKGMRVYALLATLFNGLKASDNQEAIKQQSEILDLPPINLVQYKNLVNDSGIVYQQAFFYGDEDGKTSFASFLGGFKDGKWKIVPSKYWTTISSTSGKPTTIFANNPLPEPDDEEAQKQLCNYLAERNINPTVIIHRGHSYHLPLTLERLNKYSRIVMLGSCGGYHNLATVLDKSPDAHIISSKQTGAMNVNEPIIKSIETRILEGKDVDWITMWRDLNVYFNTKMPTYKSTFSDYVPPQKNLGAIFIKAYRRLAGNDEEF